MSRAHRGTSDTTVSASRHPHSVHCRTVPIAVIAFDFDPLLRLAERPRRALADHRARRRDRRRPRLAAAASPGAAPLRLDDLLFIAVGVVPGAVIGGRLGYAAPPLRVCLGEDPSAILDPAARGLELGLGVVGGLLTGRTWRRCSGRRSGAGAHLRRVLPLLVARGRQAHDGPRRGRARGLPSTAPWATAYLGPGPWGSLAPALPSDPSQAYEGDRDAVVLVVVLVLLAARRRSDAATAGVLLVAIGRVGVRPGRGLDDLARRRGRRGICNAGALIAIGCRVGCLAGPRVIIVRARRRPDAIPRRRQAARDAALSWPDPSTRPPF